MLDGKPPLRSTARSIQEYGATARPAPVLSTRPAGPSARAVTRLHRPRTRRLPGAGEADRKAAKAAAAHEAYLEARKVLAATPVEDTRAHKAAKRAVKKAAVKSVNTRRPTARQRAAAKKAATPAGKARAASQEAKAQGKSWAEQNRLGAVARSEAARASGLCTVHVTQTIPFSGGRVDLLDRNPAGLRRGPAPALQRHLAQEQRPLVVVTISPAAQCGLTIHASPGRSGGRSAPCTCRRSPPQRQHRQE